MILILAALLLQADLAAPPSPVDHRAGEVKRSADDLKATEAMTRAARFLLSQESADGGWHSRTYGLLGSGQSLTPLVVLALRQAPSEFSRREAASLEFIRKNLDSDGTLGLADPAAADYPNYATALGAGALMAGDLPELPARMRKCLLRQQFAETRGWTRDTPAYGGWGIGGAPRYAPYQGHVDLSMTRHVLQALAAERMQGQALAAERMQGQALAAERMQGQAIAVERSREQAAEAFTRAQVFLGRCQNPDGGFFFSPVVLEANKAGEIAGRFRSYGTATADGLLSLLALGMPISDPRVASAASWLATRHRTDSVPGLDSAGTGWAEGMVSYYLAASALAFQQLGTREAPSGSDWRIGLCRELLSRQQRDGSWKNPSFLGKEDDPLIATPLALVALGAALRPPAPER